MIPRPKSTSDDWFGRDCGRAPKVSGRGNRRRICRMFARTLRVTEMAKWAKFEGTVVGAGKGIGDRVRLCAVVVAILI